jgi:hypothetical protein
MIDFLSNGLLNVLLPNSETHHTLLDNMQVVEAGFAASCLLQWWLVSGADRMFDYLKWAGNPSGSLPIRAARSLVMSSAHTFTWLGVPSP